MDKEDLIILRVSKWLEDTIEQDLKLVKHLIAEDNYHDAAKFKERAKAFSLVKMVIKEAQDEIENEKIIVYLE